MSELPHDDQPGEATEPQGREGGDAACWAHLVCPECGSVAREGHRKGCSRAPEE